MPETRKAKADRPYTHSEIGKMLEIAGERNRAIVLLLTSSGIRIGAIPSLKVRNLQGNKLVVYESFNEEYFTFITPECRKVFDSYLDMRARYGEKLTDDSPLIRNQMDVRDPFHIRSPRPLEKAGMQYIIYDLCNRAGINKKDVHVAHGFRKYFTTQSVQSKVNPEIREMLLGHKIGLASSYYRPTQDEMYAEYEKAIDALTINEENRLKKKIEILTIEKSRLDILEEKFNRIEQQSKRGRIR